MVALRASATAPRAHRARSCAAVLAALPALALLLGLGPGAAHAAAPGVVTNFPVAGEAITAGPDANLWSTQLTAGVISSMTPSGSLLAQYRLDGGSGPSDIASGPDGALWFTEIGDNEIGRITPTGAITEFPLPNANSRPDAITAGPDGALWFTEEAASRIGRITTAGSVTEFPLPTGRGTDITTGPDGALWFTRVGAGDGIGRITPTGTITQFPLPMAGRSPARIVAGSDGALWFTEPAGGRIGRITTSGSVTEFPLAGAQPLPTAIAAAPDGNLWFTQLGGSQIGRITPAGTVTNFGGGFSQSITVGPDSNLWFATGSGVGRITSGRSPVNRDLPDVDGSGRAGDPQSCDPGEWFASPALTRQWALDGTDRAGQTSRTYTPTSGDVGHALTCRVIASYDDVPWTTLAVPFVSTATSPAVTVSGAGSSSRLAVSILHSRLRAVQRARVQVRFRLSSPARVTAEIHPRRGPERTVASRRFRRAGTQAITVPVGSLRGRHLLHLHANTGSRRALDGVALVVGRRSGFTG